MWWIIIPIVALVLYIGNLLNFKKEGKGWDEIWFFSLPFWGIWLLFTLIALQIEYHEGQVWWYLLFYVCAFIGAFIFWFIVDGVLKIAFFHDVF